MQEWLKTLCALDGASSCEDNVREWIRKTAEPFADSIRTDVMGNLIIFKRGAKSAPNKLMVAAHMDEVGLMVHSITEKGYVKFVTLGSIDRRVLIGKRVFVGTACIPGIIGVKAFHLASSEERKKVPKLSDLYIDIGCQSADEANGLISPGDVIVLDGSPESFGDGLLSAKAIDDRIGCAVMLSLLEKPLPLDCTFVFTVQEEVGTRGAFGAAFSVTPEIALILEGTTAADLPDMGEHRKVCILGGGPVIPFMDGATIYDRGLFECLRDLAIQNNIPWQTKHFIAGGTDSGAIQRSRAGVRVAAISAAVRYLHTSKSIVSLRDFEAMLALSYLFLEAVAQQL